MTIGEAKRLAEKLEGTFGGKAEFEKVAPKGRYRFSIVSERFYKMSHLKRQDEIWKVVDQALKRESKLDVSIILAFAPADLSTAKT